MTLFLETNVTVLLFNESDNNRKSLLHEAKKFHVTGFRVFAYPTGAPSTARAVPLPRGARGRLEGDNGILRGARWLRSWRCARGRLWGITAYCAVFDGYVHEGGTRGRLFGDNGIAAPLLTRPRKKSAGHSE